MIHHHDGDNKRRDRFETLFSLVYEPVQRYVRRRVDADVVDDIVSETMTTLWRRLTDVPPDAQLPWAYGVAKRHIANARRGDRRRLRLIGRAAAEPRPVPLGDHPLDAELETALSELQPEDRELLRLWAWEQLEAGEIAVVMAISPNAASIRLHRAKRKLAENLEKARKMGTSAGHSHGARSKEEQR